MRDEHYRPLLSTPVCSSGVRQQSPRSTDLDQHNQRIDDELLRSGGRSMSRLANLARFSRDMSRPAIRSRRMPVLQAGVIQSSRRVLTAPPSPISVPVSSGVQSPMRTLVRHRKHLRPRNPTGNIAPNGRVPSSSEGRTWCAHREPRYDRGATERNSPSLSSQLNAKRPAKRRRLGRVGACLKRPGARNRTVDTLFRVATNTATIIALLDRVRRANHTRCLAAQASFAEP
jgi:hypothetical protein